MDRRTLWQAVIEAPDPVLADGAMGTMLFEAGLGLGAPPETWNVERPDEVRRVHRAYLAAGARLILTNTFGGSRFRLALHGAEGRVAEVNRAAARLARAEVDRAGDHALVAGDVGPSGGILAPLGELEAAEVVAGFAEQAAALVAGGVDLVWIETMSALEEVQAAIEGVRRAAPGIPIVATMSFDTHGHTMMGVSPEQAVTTLTDWGAAAVGANCGLGPDEMIAVVEKMRRAAPGAVLVAKPNVGLPELVDDRAVYAGDPATLAAYARRVRTAGARIIGACCGSTPAHLAAMANALGLRAATG